MRVLGFDTCFDACSVAVGVVSQDGCDLLAHERRFMRTGHAEQLMPMISRVMMNSGFGFGDLDLVAVTHGPGTFTGTRISVAAARSLSLATNTPIASASSLHVICEQIRAPLVGRLTHTDAVAYVRDARRGEVYMQAVSYDGRVLSPPEALSFEAAAGVLPDRRLTLAGSGAQAVMDAAMESGAGLEAVVVDGRTSPVPPENLEPDASTLLRILHAAEPSRTPPKPLYLRAADAKPPPPSPIARQPI